MCQLTHRGLFIVFTLNTNIIFVCFQDLVNRLLVVEVKRRFDADDILEHPWIKVIIQKRSYAHLKYKKVI